MGYCRERLLKCGLTQPINGLKMRRMEQTEFFNSVLARLRAVKHADLPAVAKASGVPESTLRKIRYGEVKDPRVLTVQALHDYFAACDVAAQQEAA